jgi:hypothetical protein
MDRMPLRRQQKRDMIAFRPQTEIKYAISSSRKYRSFP